MKQFIEGWKSDFLAQKTEEESHAEEIIDKMRYFGRRAESFRPPTVLRWFSRTWRVLTKNPQPFLQRVGSDWLLVALCDRSDMVISWRCRKLWTCRYSL